jgi:preprotein translocase subunit YajC
MNILHFLGIQDAVAAEPSLQGSASSTSNIMSLLPTLIIFALVFYFLLIRPQSKRAKEHRKLMDSIAKDDEVITTGGVTGKVIRLTDSYVVLEVSDKVEMTFQKSAIAMVIPKGTLKAI